MKACEEYIQADEIEILDDGSFRLGWRRALEWTGKDPSLGNDSEMLDRAIMAELGED